MARWLWVLVLVGCYNPNPPPGAYRCSASDRACPSGQHCTCGLCVKNDDQAACGFTVDVSKRVVDEHESFQLDVHALKQDGTAAGAFGGTVSLASTWGDVRPATVQLAGGAATVQVTLNRETQPPQTASIVASFAGNQSTSAKITVRPPRFQKDATPVVPPASAAAPFGFADVFVAEPNVIKTADGYRMYFGGFSTKTKYAVGVATSTDGRSFGAQMMPVFSSAATGFTNNGVSSPGVFATGTGMNMVFAASSMPFTPGDIGVASSADGLMPFTIANGNMPVLRRADCGYCDLGVEFPSVIPDPAAVGDGGAGGWLMFFSATQKGDNNSVAVAIGRATSTDGITFAAEPAPILAGTTGGEAYLATPRVLVDGTVYKMWYSFGATANVNRGNLCGTETTVQIGYATSSDGFYWIRSQANPVITLGGGGWDNDARVLGVGSVLPADGKDPASGVALYYSVYRQTAVPVFGTLCLPNGIGRATRL